MRYLQRRDDFIDYKSVNLNESEKVKLFKSSQMINETFETDIPWGDSLIGRLINSTIRKGKIMINSVRISRIPPQVEACLNDLLAAAVFTPDQQKQVIVVKIQMLLESIIKVVKGDEKVSDKLKILLGDKDNKGGLIDLTCEDVEKVEEFEDKDELLKKLKDFKEALISKKNELESNKEDEDDKDEDEPEDTDGDTLDLSETILSFFKNIKELIEKLGGPLGQDTKKGGYVRKWKDQSGKEHEVLIISQKGKPGAGKVKTGPGPDNVYNKNPDDFKNPAENLGDDEVQIVLKNPVTNKFDKDSEIKKVKRGALNESLILELATEEAVNNSEDLKKRIQSTFDKSLFDLFVNFTNTLEGKDKNQYNNSLTIIRQVIANLFTKKINVPTQGKFNQNPISKLIKPLTVLIGSLSKYKNLLDGLGDVKGVAGDVNSNYFKIKEFLEKSQKETEEKKSTEGESKDEESVSDNFKFIFSNYDQFKSNLIKEDVAGQLDAIHEEWTKHFTEDEEKKYAVNEKRARELQAASEAAESNKVKINLDNKDQFDRIVEIVNLFGKAYRLYATEFIPSGRSGGKISLKTMNEYEYIGDGDGGYNKGDWDAEENPGRGPWAARKVFEKWRNSILEIFKNQKYRKILANSEFTYGGEVPNKGAGKSLFKFMNDMISGIKGSFSKASHEILTSYFEGEAADEMKGKVQNVEFEPRKIADRDKGEKGALNFMKQEHGFLPASFKVGGNFAKTFCLVNAKIGGESRKMIIYFASMLKIEGNDYVVFKFHLGKAGKQSIVSNYLSQEISEKSLQLDKDYKFTPEEPLYVGIYKVDGNNKFLKKGQKIEISYLNVKSLRSEKSKKLDIISTDEPFLLAYLEEDKTGKQLQKVIKGPDKPAKLSSGDPGNLTHLFQNRDILRNFGLKS